MVQLTEKGIRTKQDLPCWMPEVRSLNVVPGLTEIVAVFFGLISPNCIKIALELLLAKKDLAFF